MTRQEQVDTLTGLLTTHTIRQLATTENRAVRRLIIRAARTTRNGIMYLTDDELAAVTDWYRARLATKGIDG